MIGKLDAHTTNNIPQLQYITFLTFKALLIQSTLTRNLSVKLGAFELC